jgi:hypothetical protein
MRGGARGVAISVRFALEDEEELLHVVLHLVAGAVWEFRERGLRALSRRGTRRSRWARGVIAESETLRGANHGEGLVSARGCEEVVEADVADHRDARQRRQGGDEFAVLELGKHGGGEAGVLGQYQHGAAGP